ncbi:hypothetical protein OROHE_022186 [Orobanche hederae]
MCYPVKPERDQAEEELREIAQEVREEQAVRRREEAEIGRRNWFRFMYHYRYHPETTKDTVLFKIIMYAAPLDLIKKLLETVLDGTAHMFIRDSAATFIVDIMDYEMVRLAHAPGKQDLVKFMREAGLWMLGARDGTLIKGCGEDLVKYLVNICLDLELEWDEFSAKLNDGFQKENLKDLDEVLASVLIRRTFHIEFLATCFYLMLLKLRRSCLKLFESGADEIFAVFLEAMATNTYFDKPHSTFDRTTVALMVKR